MSESPLKKQEHSSSDINETFVRSKSDVVSPTKDKANTKISDSAVFSGSKAKIKNVHDTVSSTEASSELSSAKVQKLLMQLQKLPAGVKASSCFELFDIQLVDVS